MITVTYTDLIFTGEKSQVDFVSLANDLLTHFKNPLFSFPENHPFTTVEDLVLTVNQSDYVDFTAVLDHFTLPETLIPNVFLNLGLNNDEVELLLFFDLKDIKKQDDRQFFDKLFTYSKNFKERYGFKKIVCQIDDGNKDEYYFNDRGLGPLYDGIA